MTVISLTKVRNAQLDGNDVPDWLRRRDLACIGHWEPFDYLITFDGGPGWLLALHEAWDLCMSCPLIAECHKYNADEQWLKVMKAYPPALHRVRPRRKKTS